MRWFVLYWQEVYYNVYRFNVFTQKIIASPILALLKNDFIVGLYKKRGVDNPSKIVAQVLVDPKISTVILLSDGLMITMLSVVMFSLINFLSAVVGYVVGEELTIMYFASFIIVPIGVNYMILWRNDKYLVHFKEFEKQNKAEKRKWKIISSLTIVAVIALVVLSFIVLPTSTWGGGFK